MQPPFGPATLEPILISALYNVLPPATFVADALSWLLPTPSPFILNNADHVAALTCTSLTPDADDALRRSCTQLLLHLVTSEALLQQQPQAVRCLIVSWRAELAKWRPDTSLIQALHSARLVEWQPGLDDLFDQHFVRMADTFLVAARLHWGLPREVVFQILQYVEAEAVGTGTLLSQISSKLFGGLAKWAGLG